jgi:hypothetical protein
MSDWRRSRADTVALVAGALILIGVFIGLSAYGRQLDAAAAQTGQFEDAGGYYIEKFADIYLTAAVLYGVSVVVWFSGYPRWYSRVPLLLLSLALATLGFVLSLLGPVIGAGALISAGIGLAVTLQAPRRASD